MRKLDRKCDVVSGTGREVETFTYSSCAEPNIQKVTQLTSEEAKKTLEQLEGKDI